MAYPQFGYTCPTAASSLASSQLLSMSAGSTTQTTVSTSCCETGRPIMTDPQTGQTVCSCQYSSSLLSYPRVASLSESVYGSAYATQGYVPFGTDPSAFYSPLNSAYDLKDGNDWRSLAHPTPCYPYDPTGMAAGYPYGQSALAQRKNATREATSTLKAWLQEHIKNPYPTKGEKIMLAIITKMTLTQVSTWFANARRRLKKENKMTWSPRNRSDEDGGKLDSDDEDGDGDKDNAEDGKDHKENNNDCKDEDTDSIIDAGHETDLNVCDNDELSELKVDVDDSSNSERLPKPLLPGMPPHPSAQSPSSCMSASSSKPRIWSIADVATSSEPGLSPRTTPLGSTPAHLSQQHSLGPIGNLLPGAGGNSGSSHKMLSEDSYRPAINGFRPWVNGSSGSLYPNQTGPSSQGSPTGGQNMGLGPTGLLRSYALAPRTEGPIPSLAMQTHAA